jgi:hypothetical protein
VKPKGISHKERMQRNREMQQKKEMDLLTTAVREKHVCCPSCLLCPMRSYLMGLLARPRTAMLV